MKTLIALITFFVAFQASAIQPIKFLEEGSSALLPIEGEVAMKYDLPNCPLNALCAPETKVLISYALNGCLDDITTYSKVVYNENGTYDVYVTALNISNKKSMAAMCFAMPMHQEEIFIGPGYLGEGSVNVHFMGLPENGME